MRVTACLNTSLPSILITGGNDAASSGLAKGWRDPPPGISKMSPFPPSADNATDNRSEGPSVAVRIKAPAPSPNNTHVPRSVQSVNRDRVSAPINKTVLAVPVAISPLTTANPYTNPEQAADTSNAMAWGTPRAFCTRQAVEGNR